jgi:hypothetical protein
MQSSGSRRVAVGVLVGFWAASAAVELDIVCSVFSGGRSLREAAMKSPTRQPLARLQEPDTKMRRYHPPDAIMQFLEAL